MIRKSKPPAVGVLVMTWHLDGGELCVLSRGAWDGAGAAAMTVAQELPRAREGARGALHRAGWVEEPLQGEEWTEEEVAGG